MSQIENRAEKVNQAIIGEYLQALNNAVVRFANLAGELAGARETVISLTEKCAAQEKELAELKKE